MAAGAELTYGEAASLTSKELLASQDNFCSQTQAFALTQLPERDEAIYATLTFTAKVKDEKGQDQMPAPFDVRKEHKQVLIGRHPDCDIVISDKRVSGKHLRIYWDQAGKRNVFFAQELSPNCAFINSVKLEKDDTRVLQHGDKLSLCVQEGTVVGMPAWIFTVPTNDDDETRSPRGPSKPSRGGSDGSFGSENDRQLAEVTATKNRKTEQWVRDHWDMRTVIGRGNFSEVRLGVEVKDGTRRYAVKVIDVRKFIQFQNKRDSQLRFDSEAEVMGLARHPNIVKLWQWFETGDKFYLCLEHMEGGDLLALIMDSGLFVEHQAKRVFTQLCSGVQYLHSRQCVHRDLKPENILLTCKDRDKLVPKIADFGLARILNHKEEQCGTFCGTPHYFAPEVIKTGQDKDSGGYTFQADLWSLGVILYIMLSGIPPFEEESLYEQILEGKYEFDVQEWTSVSDEGKELVRKLMTVDPQDRFSISQAIDFGSSTWLVGAAARPAPAPLTTSEAAADTKRRRIDEGPVAVPRPFCLNGSF